MKGKLDAIATPEGWNTRRASGTSTRTTPFGNTAHWNMEERKWTSQWPLWGVLEVVWKGRWMRQLESAPVKQIFCWIAKVNSIKPPWQGWWHSRACMETKEKIRQGRSSHWLELVNGQGQGGEQEEIECMDFVTFPFIWTFVYHVFHFGSETTWHQNQQNYSSYPELEEDQRFDRNMSLNIVNTVQQ